MDVSKFNWPVTGADLEAWRVQHGVSKPEAAKAFGIPMSKWYAITDADHIAEVNASQAIKDEAVVILYVLYRSHPKSAPIEQPTDITQFYSHLGFGPELTDRAHFAKLIGRSVATVYRMVDKMQMMGSPGRPVQCLIDGVERLGGQSTKKLSIMEEVANIVKNNHRVPASSTAKARAKKAPEKDLAVNGGSAKLVKKTRVTKGIKGLDSSE